MPLFLNTAEAILQKQSLRRAARVAPLQQHTSRSLFYDMYVSFSKYRRSEHRDAQRVLRHRNSFVDLLRSDAAEPGPVFFLSLFQYDI